MNATSSRRRRPPPRRACRRAARVGLLLLGCAAALGLESCADDDLFTDCPFSESIEEVCEAQASTTDFTCVVEDHPFCTEKICARYKGSETFCTRACTTDTDCPGVSTCETAPTLGVSFCVQAELTGGE